MKRLKLYCSLIILLLFLQVNLKAQDKAQDKPLEVVMIDTMAYTDLNTAHIPDTRYAVSNLVDGRLNTCWVSRLSNSFEEPHAYLALPDHLVYDPELTIHAGYWKSASLYNQNARPKKIKLTAYYGLVADGFVSEIGYLSFAYKLPGEVIIDLVDSMQAQHFSLSGIITTESYLDSLNQHFNQTMSMTALKTVTLLRLEILEAYEGTRYPDICISEIYFNDCFLVKMPQHKPEITEVYVNKEENALLIDTESDRSLLVYEDKEAVLQLIETSNNFRWAIVLTMPTEVEGRAETSYELIDLAARKSATRDIIEKFPDISTASAMYFDENRGQLYLVQWVNDQEIRVALREIY